MDVNVSGETARVEELVLISAPRSGTNFFCECLDAFPEIMGANEIFNKAGAFGTARDGQLEVINEIAGTSAKSTRDPGLIELFRGTPERGIEVLAETAARTGRNVISYKIFRGQLETDVLNALLVDVHRHVLFLVRGRLDVYVSYEKARQTDTWINANTRGMELEIDIEEFLTWSKRTDNWYRRTADTLDGLGRPYRVLSYENDVDMPKGDLIARLYDTLVADGIQVSLPAKKPKVRFKRQDVRAEPFRKIANAEGLRMDLVARGLLDYALSAPLADRDAPHGLVGSV
ncbi:hypothetical protein [Microbacterium indicum]|uniref:hypothetical protein n=1 Tax=Microbacterium indicum TaxID=358100 RepID=UPI00048CC7F9|nr:hypothetical protein [Microbacterium indicum]